MKKYLLTNFSTSVMRIFSYYIYLYYIFIFVNNNVQCYFTIKHRGHLCLLYISYLTQ